MYERNVLLDFFDPNGDHPRLMVDVGAHFGENTLPFAKRGWSVLSFEPELNNYNILCQRVAQYSRVQCFRYAVSDEDRAAVPFYISSVHSGIHSLQPFHDSHKIVEGIICVSLGSFLTKIEVANIDILKIDVEGADFLVLKGLDWDKFRPTLVLAEFMDKRSLPIFGYSVHDMASFMGTKGYEGFIFEYSNFEEYGSDIHINAPRFLGAYPYTDMVNPVWGNIMFFPIEYRSTVVSLISRFEKESIFLKIIRYPSFYLSFVPVPIRKYLNGLKTWLQDKVLSRQVNR